MRNLRAIALPLVALALVGCHTDMWKQGKVHKALQDEPFFADNSSARPIPAHTVARGMEKADEEFFTGIRNGTRVEINTTGITQVETGVFRGTYADKFPFKITKADMERGQDRFNIYCSPCHGLLGDGKGMIAQRGFNLRRKPANYHTDRLRKLPIGHFFDAITNGFGVMYGYKERVEPADRWRIVAYIRALQYSQNAPISALAGIQGGKNEARTQE